MTDLDDYPVVPDVTKEYLNPHQLLDYRSEREDCLRWLLAYGKDPKQAAGYAPGTVRPRCYRMDRFYRFLWDQKGGYTADGRPEHADDWMEQLVRAGRSNAENQVIGRRS